MTYGGSKRLKYIDYLKAFAIILVVIGHGITYYEVNYALGIGLEIISQVIYTIHVPLFFMIAGYLCHPKGEMGGGYLKSKIFRLLIPLYFFGTLKVLYTYLLEPGFSHTGNCWGDIAEVFYSGVSYWYCYALFLMYMIAPVLWGKRTNTLMSIIIFIIILNMLFDLFHIKLTDIFQINNTKYFVIFFIFGMYINQGGNKIINLLIVKRKIILPIDICIIVMIIYFNVIESKITPLRVMESIIFIIPILYLSIEIEKRVDQVETLHMKNKGRNSLYLLLNKALKMIATYTLQIMFLDSFFKVILFKLFINYIGMTEGTIFIISILNIMFSILCCRVFERIPYMRVFIGLQGVNT